jgi:hypothetical protein
VNIYTHIARACACVYIYLYFNVIVTYLRLYDIQAAFETERTIRRPNDLIFFLGCRIRRFCN